MVVKLSSKEIHHLGESYGTLSALWSLGSIIGVFSSGFYLIPFFGTWKTLALVVAVLALCGAMLWRGTHRLIGILLIIGAMIPLWNLTPPQGRNVLYSTDTPYFRAVVAEAYIPPIGSSRILFLDTGTHSIHRGTTTIPIYTDSTTLLSRYLGTSSRALVMGGGAYTMPNDLAREMESVDVYEIDPAIPQIVNKYFSMNSKIVTHIGDARQLLRKSPETYDLIVGDSFNSYLAVPWHLLTKEFNREVIQHVSERGLYAISIIAPLEGDGSELYKTVDATLRAVFPFVDAYRFGASPSEIQNIVFVASPSPLDALRTLAQKTQVIPGASGTFADRRVAPPSSSVSVFTDDHTSTETMLLPIARRSLPDSLRLYYGITKQ